MNVPVRLLILLLVLTGLAIGGKSRDMGATETKLDVVTVTAQKRLVGDRFSSLCVDSWFGAALLRRASCGPYAKSSGYSNVGDAIVNTDNLTATSPKRALICT